jgi:tetratricopeptide (TPR) repeat protein
MTPVRVLLLIVAALAVYANGLDGPLVLDDQITIVENPQIRHLWSREVLMPERELPVAGRPLANLTFAVNYAIGGTSVRGYHVGNLIVHVLCGLVLFMLIARVLSLPSLSARFGAVRDDIACAVALLWLVHPLNSEIIGYLTQRTEALMALFYLLTLYASVRALGAGGRRWTVAAIAACIAGALCKESMATAPVAVVLFDRAFVFDSWREAWKRRRGLYIGLAGMWIVLGLILLTGPRIRSAGFGTDVDAWTYLLNQTVMIPRYLWLTIWPRPLVVYYGWPRPLTLAGVLPYALFVVALLGTVIAAARYRPKLAFLGFWVFLTLAPTSSIVPIATEVGAERRLYLGLMALIALAVAALWSVRTKTAVRYAVVGVLTVLLGATTWARNREYADPLQLAQVTVERWPSGVSHHMLGEQLLLAGRRDEGVAELREAIADAPRAHYSLGMQMYKEGRLDEAISELQAFVRLQPLLLEVPSAQVTLARALAQQQRLGEAETQAREAVMKAPDNVDARAVYAEILFKEQKVPDAIAAYAAYLRFRPGDTVALTNTGVLLIASGRTEEALNLFRKAADADPANGEARRNLAMALLDSGKVAEASAEARRAVTLRPQDPVTYDLLGQALARQGQFDEALRQFERALQIEPRYAEAAQHRAQLLALRR